MFGKNKKIIIIFFAIIFLASGILLSGIFSVKTARAQGDFWTPSAPIDPLTSVPVPGGSIATYDAAQQMEMERLRQEANKEANKTWWDKIKEYAKEKQFDVVMSSMLQNFSRQFASQVANKLTTGGPGGEGFGWKMPYGEYLKSAGLSAAGDFIGSLSQVFGVDLCDPPLLNGKLELTMALIMDVVRPPKPRCEWTEIAKNWNKMDEGEFLEKFGASFEPNVNYLGSSFALRDKLKKSAADAELAALLKRGQSIDVGYKDLVDIGGWIKTPATAISELAQSPMWEDRFGRLGSVIGRYGMGNILAPALDTFLTTVAGNLIERWTTKGQLDYSAYDLADREFNWLKDPNSAGTTPSVSAGIGKTAADFEKGFTRPHFEPGGNRDILSELSTCPDSKNPGPTSCVIDSNFRIAIEQKMTVGMAMANDKQYLNKDAIFGFASKDTEPKYNEGYPLRSMRILRRYRIIPVGWEIAAEYINMPNNSAKAQRYSLKDMVDCYSPNDEWRGTDEEWCRGLVDPNWLLKAPANSCEGKTYGQEIVSEYFLGQIGDELSKRVVSRNQFCTADKSCVVEAANGKCLKWGYCAEEKKIWRFTGDACDEQFNTCQELTRINTNVNTNQRENVPVSYLKNTLDFGICGADNAGCKWYCSDYDYNSSKWTCGATASSGGTMLPTGNALFFDNGAESCDEKNEGCHKFLRVSDGANLLYNGGMENGGENLYIEGLEGKEGTDGDGAAEKIAEGRKAAEDKKFNGWPVAGENIKISLVDGAAKIETTAAGAGIYSYDAADSAKMEKSMMPQDYSFDFSKSYVLSADVKVEIGKAKIGIKNAGGADKKEEESTKIGEWERLYVYLAKGTFLPESIYIYSSSLDNGEAVFYVDNVFLGEYAKNPPNPLWERGNYNEYENASNAVYIKKAPDYLANKCAPPRFAGISDTRPAECKKYATECKEEEAGCAKYSPTNGDPWIPAILSEGDKCDPECVNYKSYKQSSTNFSHEILNIDFIADNPYAPSSEEGVGGRLCPAQEIGCTEFTNLDKLEKGGEAREYYSELKQCVATDADGKPIQADETCGTFYTWTGSDTAGYELNTYYLSKNPPNPLWERGKQNEPGAPVEILNPQDLGKCEGAEDLAANYNCREFYNESGQKFYAIYRNTVQCSENCKPYRRTRENLNQSACELYGSAWVSLPANHVLTPPNPPQGGISLPTCSTNCVNVCKMELENCLNSGGSWNFSNEGEQGECIYKAIPGEGITCAAQNVGCNEYQGTTSGNVKTVLRDDFEDGGNGGWVGGNPSSAAVLVGTQCLTLSSSAPSNSVIKEDKEKKFKAGKNYIISFLAYNKSADEQKIKVIFKGADFYATREIALPQSEWKDRKADIFLSGDLNEDKKIDSADLAILTKAADNPMSVTARQRELADIDGDGKITGKTDGTDGTNKTDKDLLQEFISAGASVSQTIEIAGMATNIYLDNIVIKEIQGNIYRIKDSWTVPAVCDSPRVSEQLRCAEYTDNSGNILQIKKFSNFCSSEAVGCEKMIDTANSESAFESSWDLTSPRPSPEGEGATSPRPSPEGERANSPSSKEGAGGRLTVPCDKIVYFVNNPDKYCYGGADNPSKFKGCQRFGVPQFNQEKTALVAGEEYGGDVYIINDPDKYGTILCEEAALECEEYKYTLGETQGSLYFKDPGEKTCEFKNGKWVKSTSPLPSPAGEGASSPSFEEGAGGRLCPVATDINLTIGNAPVALPTDGWAGICPSEQSGCAEYIDPLNDNEPNEVVNGGFEQDIQGLGDSAKADGPDDWSDVTGCGSLYGLTPPYPPQGGNCDRCCSEGYSKTKAIKKGTQKISTFIEDTLYTLSARAQGVGAISISECSVESPDGSMSVSESGASFSFDNAEMMIRSGRFYLKNLNGNGECLLSVNATDGFVDEVNIQKTGLYYYISQSIDKGGCQNNVNSSEGCILVNEREFIGNASASVAHKPLTYSADIAYGDKKDASFSCKEGASGCSLSANEVIKVEPDRVCGKWLQEGNTEIGESGEILVRDVDACVVAKSDGTCARTVVEPMANMNFQEGNVSLMKNISGLSKAGFEWDVVDEKGSAVVNKIEGYYPVSAMSEIGQYIEFPGGFEDSVNGSAVGWDKATGFSVIDNPVSAQDEDLEKRAPVGKGFAKLSGNAIGKLSEPLPVSGNLGYILSGYINTSNINTSAKSGIYVHIFKGDEELKDKEIKLEINQGIKKWNYLLTKFTTPATAAKIKITIENRSNLAGEAVLGDSYFDEIAIHPALSIYYSSQTGTLQDSLNQSGMAPSLCKSYPEENSLSCEYKGDNNIRYLGTKGYCLEYDRAPGNPSVCISWYPVDIIRGEEGRDVPPITFAGFDEGPLYYCLEGQFLESRKVIFLGKSGIGDGDQGALCDHNYSSSDCFTATKEWHWCLPNEENFLAGFIGFPLSRTGCQVVGASSFDHNDSNEEALFYYDDLGVLHGTYGAIPYREIFQLRCAKIVQVATVDGNSQVWAERLNPASKYAVQGLSEKVNGTEIGNGTEKGYIYWSSSPVYGALQMGKDGSDVTAWDAENAAGTQPVNIKISWKNDPLSGKGEYAWEDFGMGLPYSCNNLDYPDKGCVTPEAVQQYSDKKIQRSINAGVKNNLSAAKDKLKQLFTRSYGGWQWTPNSNTDDWNDGKYEKLGAGESFEYYEFGVKAAAKILSSEVVQPAQVITWIENVDSQCYRAWKWDGASYKEDAAYSITYDFEDNGGNITSKTDTSLMCKSGALAFQVKDILTDDVKPKIEKMTEVRGDNAVPVTLSGGTGIICYSYTFTSTEKVERITEEKLANSAAIGTKTITDSSEQRIISKTMNKDNISYQYQIELSKSQSNFVKGAKVDCPIPTKKTISPTWEPPTTVCATANHLENETYCAIKPKVANIKIEGRTGGTGENISIGPAGNIVLSFNSIIDPNQEPLTGYYISWGDGVEYSVEGKRKKPQPVPENPHKFGHPYYYNDTRNTFTDSGKAINNAACLTTAGSQLCCFTNSSQCPNNSDCCFVRPSIRIKDNWEWCNNGVNGASCSADKSGWASYANWIIVTKE